MGENRYNIHENYGRFLDSFTNIVKDKIENYNDGEITKEIYYQIFKIHYYAGRYCFKFNRRINHSIADIFQDIIAYYLKVFLDDEYEVFLEEKNNNYRPDILIKKNNKNYFIIEIKTNIGWERGSIKNGKFENRIKEMASVFNVKENNIIYIFESPGNVNKEFLEKYYDINKEEAKKHRPTDSPYKYIFPLFNITDPYYMKELKNVEIYSNPIDDKKIEEISIRNIVTNFEDIIKMINKK